VNNVPGKVFAGLAVAVVLAVSLVKFTGSSREGVVVSSASARTLQLAPAGTGPVQATIDRAVIVERRATVVDINAVEGQFVTAGQQLLRVYTIGQSAAVAAATNQLRADENQLVVAQATYGAAGAQTQTLISKVAQDRTELTQLKNSPTVITAPVSGQVSGLDALPGSTLDRSDVVLHVVDDTIVRVVVPLVVAYRSQMELGAKALLTLPSLPGRTFDASITGIGAVVPAQADGKALTAEDTVPVTVDLPNADDLVMTGAAAYVRFPMTRTAPVAVNSLAVYGQADPYVFIVENRHVRLRHVEVGATDGAWTEIKSGLSTGDDVVVSGGGHLVDGAAVNVSRVRT
jgi:membrane fusion protein (multidrug efflux system)